MSNKIVLYNWGEPLMQQIDEDRIVHLCRWLATSLTTTSEARRPRLLWGTTASPNTEVLGPLGGNLGAAKERQYFSG